MIELEAIDVLSPLVVALPALALVIAWLVDVRKRPRLRIIVVSMLTASPLLALLIAGLYVIGAGKQAEGLGKAMAGMHEPTEAAPHVTDLASPPVASPAP